MIYQLSDAQRSVLEPACARDDLAVFPIVAALKGGAVGNVCKSLLTRGLIEEVAASDTHCVWRHSDDGPLTLRATEIGRQALAGEAGPVARSTPIDPPEPATSARERSPGRAKLLEMLERAEGASVAQITEALGWQPHSVRAALSGIRKQRGDALCSEKLPDRGRVYRIS